MLYRTVGNYEIRALGKKDLDIMEEILNAELPYKHPEFETYFHSWMQQNLGIFFFPKEKHFVSWKGVNNYAIALLQYGANVKNLKQIKIEK